jgi:hypothetical protein
LTLALRCGGGTVRIAGTQGESAALISNQDHGRRFPGRRSRLANLGNGSSTALISLDMPAHELTARANS